MKLILEIKDYIHRRKHRIFKMVLLVKGLCLKWYNQPLGNTLSAYT